MEEKIKTCYELWGSDDFTSVKYLCGVYAHYSSAWRSKKRHEKKYSNPKYEDEVLGDKYWIVKTSIDEHNAKMAILQTEIDGVYDNIRRVNSIAEDAFPSIKEFIKTCINKGEYDYPLPKAFGETSIVGVKFSLNRETKKDEEYSFIGCILIGENGVLMQKHITTFASGNYEKVVNAIENVTFWKDVTFLFDFVIDKYYSDKFNNAF